MKLVIMNRAIPGSGKSSITRRLTEWIQKQSFSLQIHSTDDFFMQENRYIFDLSKWGLYHKENLKNFESSLKKSVNVVICDNTNLAPWETKPYTDLARKYEYKILFLNFAPRDIKQHIESQKVTETRPDAHQVPDEVLISFFENFLLYNELLKKDSVLDPQKHRNYQWNYDENKKIDAGALDYKFDLDACVDISPQDYHEYKKNIEILVQKIFN